MGCNIIVKGVDGLIDSCYLHRYNDCSFVMRFVSTAIIGANFFFLNIKFTSFCALLGGAINNKDESSIHVSCVGT